MKDQDILAKIFYQFKSIFETQWNLQNVDLLIVRAPLRGSIQSNY